MVIFRGNRVNLTFTIQFSVPSIFRLAFSSLFFFVAFCYGCDWTFFFVENQQTGFSLTHYCHLVDILFNVRLPVETLTFFLSEQKIVNQSSVMYTDSLFDYICFHREQVVSLFTYTGSAIFVLLSRLLQSPFPGLNLAFTFGF